MIYLIVLAVWLVGAIITYSIVKNWSNSGFEKVWFSIVWPVLIPLLVIHLIHNTNK